MACGRCGIRCHGRLSITLFAVAVLAEATVGDSSARLAAAIEGPPTQAHHYVFRQQVSGSTPLGIIQVGSPPTDVTVIMDTGSEKAVLKTWATLKRRLAWMDGSWEQYVEPTKGIYDAEQSTSYKKAWVTLRGERRPKLGIIAYGSGLAMTRDGYDQINVGGRSLPDFPFSEILADSLRMLHTKEGAAGILGLQHMKNRTYGVSVFTAIRDMGQIYSFGYCRDAIKDRGTFTWGDLSAEGHALDVIGQIHWAVNLANVSIPVENSTGRRRFVDFMGNAAVSRGGGDTKASAAQREGKHGKYIPFWPYDIPEPQIPMCSSERCVAIIDTGSNIISGPSIGIMTLSRHLKVRYDCSNMASLPDIHFTLGTQNGTKNITIPPQSYVMKIRLPAHLAGSSSSKSKNPWAAAFEEVRKVHGFDLSGALGGDSIENLRGFRSICIPALVPLDARTQHGDLWVVGTPLFDNYYTRWSWPYNSTTPQIFVKELDRATTCKGQDWNWVQWGRGMAGKKATNLNVDSETSLENIVHGDPPVIQHHDVSANVSHNRTEVAQNFVRPQWKVLSDGVHGDLRSEVPEGSPGSELLERDLSDIKFPHWAKHLTVV